LAKAGSCAADQCSGKDDISIQDLPPGKENKEDHSTPEYRALSDGVDRRQYRLASRTG
jgi:hypothetical protein